MSDSGDRLPRAPQALLERWPVPEKSDQFWDEACETVLTRVQMVRAGSTDDVLLKAPLPAEIGEGSKNSRPATTARPAPAPPSSAPVSLADLARAVANDSGSDNSKDIARESLSLATRARTSAPSIPDSMAELGSVRPSAPPAISAPPPPASAPAPAPAAPAPALPAPRPGKPKRSMAGPLVAAGLAVIGMAAAAVIVVKSRHTDASAPIAAAPPPAAATAGEPSTAAAQQSPTAEEQHKADMAIVSPSELPAGGEPEAEAAAQRPLAKGAPPPAAPAAKAAPEEKREPVAKEEAKPEPPRPEPPGKDDEEAKKMKPAAQPTDVPQQPSSGAVQAAVGSVLGSARACVAGHDAPSRATIVFGSDGGVQNVAVSGPAAGTPAEACIRAALKRARVAPFAKPSFSVGVTVRP